MKIKAINILLIIFIFSITSCGSTKLTVFDDDILNNVTGINKFSAFDIVPNKSEKQFTICVIPDIQKYTFYKTQKVKGYPFSADEILYSQMNWIAENGIKNGGILNFAIFTGDLVEEPTHSSEWVRACNAFNILKDVIPFSITIGNHDTDRMRKLNSFGVTTFKKYDKLFGPKSEFYNNCNYYLESFDSQNSITSFSTNGYDFIVISLELQPREKTLKWLEDMLVKYKNIPTIISIHEYIHPVVRNGEIVGDLCTSNKLRKDKNNNSAKDTWEKVISKYNQVFMVLSGHYKGESYLKQTNENGYEVYAMHADYEFNSEVIDEYTTYNKKKYPSGDGWLRLLTFDIENKYIHVQTYSPYLNRLKNDEKSDFYVTWNWDWNTRFGGKL